MWRSWQNEKRSISSRFVLDRRSCTAAAVSSSLNRSDTLKLTDIFFGDFMPSRTLYSTVRYTLYAISELNTENFVQSREHKPVLPGLDAAVDRRNQKGSRASRISRRQPLPLRLGVVMVRRRIVEVCGADGQRPLSSCSRG